MWMFDPCEMDNVLKWLVSIWAMVFSKHIFIYSVFVVVISLTLEESILEKVHDFFWMFEFTIDIESSVWQFLTAFSLVAVGIPFLTIMVATAYFVILFVLLVLIPEFFSGGINFVSNLSSKETIWMCQAASPPVMVVIFRLIRQFRAERFYEDEAKLAA